ncbi:MAG: hypothetical protein DHS20C17_34310 [Cyclobacteriaceae bacterium]|nr:MAG: hypothetical protein DHS20C17_34310 [Cyclobacteriaceae bacterium]
MEIKKYILCLFLLTLMVHKFMGQDLTMVQIKTLDHQLKPYPALQIAINQGPPNQTDQQGVAFVEINPNELPPNTVNVINQKLEVESWNFSKGILEVVVRAKTHQEVTITLQDQRGKPITGIPLVYQTDQPITAISNELGLVRMNLPIEHDLNKTNLFHLKEYRLTAQKFNGSNGYLELLPIPKARASKKINSKNAANTAENSLETIDGFRKFNFEYLDSIQSLTVFYAVIKNIDLRNIDEELKRRIDDKFYQLVGVWNDSLKNITQSQFTGSITDSTLLQTDVSLLIEQAIKEQNTLDRIKNDFDSNVRVLEEKLREGGVNLSDNEQLMIFERIRRLSEILNENEQKFLKNRAQFNSLLTLLSSKLTSIDELEEKLSLSEQQLEIQTKDFNRKILTAIAIALALGLFGMISVILTRKFQRQKNQLAKANDEVKRMNEHLEDLVTRRTGQLEEANMELDTFLYKSSHNLRRPLTSIVGLSNLARITLQGEACELFERAADTAKNMDRMLKKLINVNEINNPSQYGPVNFSSQIKKILDDYSELIADRNIDVKSSIQSAINYSSHPELTAIILQSLIENALFYSTVEVNGQRPLVKLDIEQTNGTVSINLTNNGPGIDPTIQEKIWNMFFVGHESSKGNGLGLYIARKAVKTLQGTLMYHLDESGHPTFEVLLPTETESQDI